MDHCARILCVAPPPDVQTVQRLLAVERVPAPIVDEAATISAALERLALHDYDLVLLAGALVGQDDRMLRQLVGVAPQTPLVVLTTADADHARILAAGAEFLIWPGLDAPTLARAVRAAVREHGLAVQVREAEREHAELLALRASVDYLVAGSGLDGTLQSWNAGAERLLGYTADEVLGQSLLMLVPSETVAQVHDLIARAAAGTLLGHIEVTVLHKDGTRILLSLAVLPVRDRDGMLLGTIGIGRDITAQRAAEVELVRSRSHFANVLEHSRDGIFQLNLHTGMYDYCSPSMSAVLGYPLDELLSSGHEALLALLHPEDRERVLYENKRLLWTPADDASASEVEYRMLTGHRDWRWISERRTLIRDADGAPVFVVGNLRDVTDDKALLEAVQISEERYRHIVEMTAEGIFMLDLPSQISFVNRRAAEILGYPAQEMVGRALADLLPADAAATIEQQLAARLAGHPAHYELQVTHADGQRLWCEFSTTPIRNGDGQIVGSVGMVRDITSRKQAEQALRASEAGLSQAQRIAHLGSFSWNTTSDVQQWSDELYRILGWQPRAIEPGRAALLSCVDPDDQAAVERALSAMVGGAQPHTVTYRIVRPDGEQRVVEMQQELLPAAATGDRIVGGTILDVTERRHVEQALQRSQEQLEVALRRAGIGLWEWFVQANRVVYGPTWKSQLGYGEHEIADEPREWESRVHPDDLAETWAHIGGQLKSATPNFDTTHRIRHKDGTYRWIMSRGTIQRDAQGAPLRVLVANIDITELKQAEEALMRTAAKLQLAHDELEQRVHERTLELVAAKDEAERANAAKSDFLSRMSHELRTPLNSVLGFAQIMELEELSAKQTERIGYIMKAGRHLLQLINEVLDMAKVEAGYLAVMPEPVPIVASLHGSLELLGPLARERDLRIVFESGGAERYVRADQQRLSQVLLNLLSNAAKYNRAGGEIVVTVTQPAVDRIRVAVRDTGPGIAAADLPRLFTPFERLGVASASVEGTGLGLALSRRLIELMDGTIGVESTLGEGSCFWLELPRALEAAGATQADAAMALPGAERRIVYIEDNLANVAVVEHVLAELPHVQLVTAMQGQLGLDLVREVRPALVLLDLQLPDVSGVEVLRRLRAAEATATIPVVVLSADATPQRRAAALALGAHAYLSKPFDVRRLLDIVTELLDPPAASQRDSRQ